MNKTKEKNKVYDAPVVNSLQDARDNADLAENTSLFKGKIWIAPIKSDYDVDQMTSKSVYTFTCPLDYKTKKFVYPISLSEFSKLEMNSDKIDYDPATRAKEYQAFFHPDNFRISITGKIYILDMEKEMDRLYYNFLKKFYPDIIAFEGVRPTSEHRFKVVNQEETAKEDVRKHTMIAEAMSIAFKLSPVECKSVLIIVGILVQNESDDMIKSRTYAFIKDNAETFIKIVKNPFMNEIATFRELLLRKVLVKKGKAIFYNELLLGENEDEAVSFLRDKKNQYVEKELLSRLEDFNKI